MVLAGVSGQAGSTSVGTVSGFSCATETGWIPGLADRNSPGTSNGGDISTSAAQETTSGSGFSVKLRPSRLRDLRTMVLVCVTAGVGWSSSGAGTETDSLTGDWRPTLRRVLESKPN